MVQRKSFQSPARCRWKSETASKLDRAQGPAVTNSSPCVNEFAWLLPQIAKSTCSSRRRSHRPGAGPLLARLGIRVRINRKKLPSRHNLAPLWVCSAHPRVYARLARRMSVVQQGRSATAANLWTKGIALHTSKLALRGRTKPIPSLIYPQDEHERSWSSPLSPGHHRRAPHRTHRIRARRSFGTAPELSNPTAQRNSAARLPRRMRRRAFHRRERLGIGSRGNLRASLLCRDVEADSKAINGELNIAFDRSDFLVVFPAQGENRARFIRTIRDPESLERPTHWNESANTSWNVCASASRRSTVLDLPCHHRVAGHFRSGPWLFFWRCRPHHSPVGGQGMNTGIGRCGQPRLETGAVLRNPPSLR